MRFKTSEQSLTEMYFKKDVILVSLNVNQMIIKYINQVVVYFGDKTSNFILNIVCVCYTNWKKKEFVNENWSKTMLGYQQFLLFRKKTRPITQVWIDTIIYPSTNNIQILTSLYFVVEWVWNWVEKKVLPDTLNYTKIANVTKKIEKRCQLKILLLKAFMYVVCLFSLFMEV